MRAMKSFLLKSCLFTTLIAASVGASSAIAGCRGAPLPPNVPPGTTVVFVPGHYSYYRSHHKVHRYWVRPHYVSYSYNHWYGCCGYTYSCCTYSCCR